MDKGEILVPIVMFIMIFGIVYVAIAARNKERLALIEKGADASLFKYERSPKSGLWILRLGIIAIGVAIGILVGYLLDAAGMNQDAAYATSIFFFGGVAMVIAYFLSKFYE